MQQKTKAKLEQLNTEAGFSLLELVAVMAVLGLLASSLGMTLTNQFRFWEFGSNRVQVINEANLVKSYLKQDIAESISYELTEAGFDLEQDRNGDGNIERVISYQDEGGQLKRSVSYESYLPDVEGEERIIATTFAGLENGEESSDYQLDLELEFLAGDAREKLTKSFYLADRQSSNLNNSLEFDGSEEYVALDHYLAGADYEELTLLAKIKPTEDSGVIYGFDENNYFSLGLDDGNWEFKINGQSFDFETTIDVGEEAIVGVSVNQGEVNSYINGEFDNLGDLNNDTFGSGNTSYGFLGVDSRANSFDGARANDYFAGQIYWLQHWDKALTEQQLDIYSSVKISGKEDGLRAYYPIRQDDEVLYDYLGERHGVLNGPTYTRD